MAAIAIADHRPGVTRPLDAPDVQGRIVDAGLRCVARWGLAKTTVDDIAREAGCARATVYRAFPGGRDALLSALLDAEVGRVQCAVAGALDTAGPTLEDRCVAAMVSATRSLRASAALTFLLDHEPEVVRPAVAFSAFDAVLDRAATFAAPWFEADLGPLGARRAVEWLVRLVASHLFLPDPAVDFADAGVARRLVTTFVLPGLRPDSIDPTDPTDPTR